MDATLPSRPTTYVVDDRLTASEVENFRDLKVDPKSLAEELSPVAGGAKDDAPASGLATRQGKTRKASLPIINLSSSYADITINGLAVGRI